ncbi:MAG: hypothetical protein JWR18_264 [Segetibacter sp.]|nr:hypothetical protein [Segetibacter sp.]
MKQYLLTIALSIALIFPLILSAQNNIDLDKYIQRLKDDKAGPLKETGFLSAGSDFLYGQEYFEAKNYSSAEWYFKDAVKKQKDNSFANYQLAISLIRQNDQNKKQQAQEYLDAAFRLNPLLKENYKKDIPEDTTSGNDQAPPTKANFPENNNGGNNNKKIGLAAYIEGLKSSKAAGGTETAMGTAGREALYGMDYYEANEYRSAETSFALALAKEANNAYINYLMAVSMAAQGKNEAAKPYFQKAVTTDPTLKESYNKDVAIATGKWQGLVGSRTLKTPPPIKKTDDGPLVFGNYTCHQSVWNGPNKSPAYSFRYKGNFSLNSNGTYKWLDNGEAGTYKYNAKTGEVTWLSGYFKTSGAKATKYQPNTETAQLTVNFSESYRWECGCKK